MPVNDAGSPFMTTIHTVLKQYWGHDAFRPMQEEIIRSVLDGKDTLALLPTGGGKSVCFQVPALMREGICIVISPLIALMKDQVQNLTRRGIEAKAVYSGMGHKEVDVTLDNCVYGSVKFLYVSPERLLTTLFIERVKKMKVNCIAVDEAHCISQWGYDFRPPYLQIAEIRQYFPTTPVIALTATATPAVCDDIQQKLAFRAPNIFSSSFKRENISFIVRESENKEDKLLEILRNVKGTGVVYVRNRKKTKEVSDFLTRNKISADYYHAGLDNDTRSNKQEKWIQGKTRIIVCTNAFGMGIDKPDVRVVVHLDIPDSLEAYFQEAGRGGRDGHKSFAGLVYDEHDFRALKENLEKQFPPIDYIKNVYHQLGNYLQVAFGAGGGESFDFDLMDFARQFQLKPAEARNALHIIEQNNYIYTSEAFNKLSTIFVPVDRETLYRYQIENKNLEPVIKMILRTSPGVFDDITPVFERDLAYHLSMDPEQLKERLRYLHKNGIIDYAPVKTKPQITFLRERVAAEHLLIDAKLLEQLRRSAEARLASVTEYVRNKRECRVTVLLRYFGEKSAPCGNCDICVERNKLELSDKEFEVIFDWLQEQLKNNPQSPELLLHQKLPFRKEKIAEALSFLTDNKKVIHTKENVLIWRD